MTSEIDNTDSIQVKVGSTVRVETKVRLPPKHWKKRGGDTIITVARRSIVATLPDKSGHVSLIQDDLAPVPLGRRGKFLIAPMFNSVGVEVKECEAVVDELKPLLDFENGDCKADDATSNDDVSTLVQRYKDYGDQLLRINDYTCAISYYEAALNFVSTKVEIGGTVVVNREGHSTIAEVDYIEENDGNSTTSYDVTLPSGEEATVNRKDILLAVWSKDDTFKQIKILLNLSRCLLKLADTDTTRGNSSCVGETNSSTTKSRQDKYRQRAVLGSSLALTLCEYHELDSSDETTLDLMEKARNLRGRAFIGLRLRNATVDIKKVLAQNSTNREADFLLAEIKAIEQHSKSLDKKISKEVCRWVQTATSSSNGAEVMDRMSDSVSEEVDAQREESDVRRKHVKPEETGIDVWGLVRGISMEIAGIIAFVAAMFIMYTPSE